MNLLGAISSFIKVVEAGSIVGGAKTLGISAAAVSQNIRRLEKKLGVQLLSRTTRSLALTESGSLYYDKVKTIERDLELAQSAITDLHAQPQGRLCIASTSGFGRHVLAPLIPDFAALYPRLTLELLINDRKVSHNHEGIDISFRIKPQLEEGLVARQIASVPFIVCASPAYLEQHGRPQSPEELQNHACLVFRYPLDGRFLRWGFIRNRQRFDAPINVTLISDDIDALAQMAAQGGGIVRLAEFVAASYIERGQLVPLFEYQRSSHVYAEPEPLDIYLCVQDRMAITPKVRAFMDYLHERLTGRWPRALVDD